MTTNRIGDIEGDWQLKDRLDRMGSLELWKNLKTEYYGVYLYEHKQDDYWILHAIKGSEKNARYIFDRASAFLK